MKAVAKLLVSALISSLGFWSANVCFIGPTDQGKAIAGVKGVVGGLIEMIDDCGRPSEDDHAAQLLISRRPCWKGPYIRKHWLTDPWDGSLLIEATGDAIWVVSLGPDQVRGSDDDYTACTDATGR